MVVVVEQLEKADMSVWEAMRGRLGPEWFTEDFEPVVREYFEQGTIQGLRHVVLLAWDGTEVLGFAEVSLRNFVEGCESGPVGYLEGWFVVERARKSGVGRALLAAGERWARDQGCSEFGSDALIENEASRRAHLALGFEEVCAIRCFRKSLD